ncbi:MAG: hypothetical protein F7O42_07305 [Opitutae bacterium]|nr:hypothetical protein [Opitutae bacterium]
MQRVNNIKYAMLCILCLFMGYELTITTRLYVMDLVSLFLGPLCFLFTWKIGREIFIYLAFGIFCVLIFALFDTQGEPTPYEVLKGAARNLGYVFSIVIGFFMVSRLGLKKGLFLILIISLSFSLYNLFVHQIFGYSIRQSLKYGGGYYALNSLTLLSPNHLVSCVLYAVIFPFLGVYYHYRGIILMGIVTGILPILWRLQRRMNPALTALILGTAVVASSLLVYNYLQYRSEMNGTIIRDTASTETRYDMVLDAVEQFRESPLIGNGSYSQSFRHFDALDSSYFTGVHSVFLQLLAEYGILGGLFSIVYFIGPIGLLFIRRLRIIFSKEYLGRFIYPFTFLLVHSGYSFFFSPFTGFWRNIFGLTVGACLAILYNEDPIYNQFPRHRRGRDTLEGNIQLPGRKE